MRRGGQRILVGLGFLGLDDRTTAAFKELHTLISPLSDDVSVRPSRRLVHHTILVTCGLLTSQQFLPVNVTYHYNTLVQTSRTTSPGQ